MAVRNLSKLDRTVFQPLGQILREAFSDGLIAEFTPNGSSATDKVRFNFTDTSTHSSGYNRGMYINWTNTGAKTGSAEINAFAVDFSLQASCPYVYGMAVYAGHSGNPAIGFFSGWSLYLDDIGTNVGGIVGLDLGFAATNSPSGRHAFIRCRKHTANVPDTVLLLEGAGSAKYLLKFDQVGNLCVTDAGAVAGNRTHKIKCECQGTEFYINGYAA